MSNFGSPGQKPGLEIWRIEQMEPAAVDPSNYGHFHSGDSYIVLQTIQKSSYYEYHLFFWLGKDSSQDERGACAYQTVALDDLLGGAPVQHREVQGHESNLFMAAFPQGVQYLEGGVDSAFNHVDPDAYEPRLFQCKGKRTVRVVQVELSAAAMNQGDVFILDKGKTLYQWNGTDCNRYEKVKALEMVTKIRNEERGGKAEVVVLESGTNDDDPAFWELLGSPDQVQSAEVGGSDDAAANEKPKLFRVSDESGIMNFALESEGNLSRDQLDTNDAFIVDSGTEVFVWVGKGANKEERKRSMEFGGQYLESTGRPDWTPLTRVMESGETPAFKALFGLWDPPKIISFDDPAEAKKAKEQAQLDVSELFAKRDRAEEKMVDDASGSIKVWRIEDFSKQEIPEVQHGQFFAGDSYIVLYTYEKNHKPAWIIYFWQGRDSSQDEKASSAMLAMQLDDEMGGDPVQVRVVQGKEPNHFLSLFKGRMIVHEGGRASAFKNRQDTDSYDTDGISLYHVRGTNDTNTRAVQVAEVASSLNSGDCFVLLTPETMYVWCGKGANEHEVGVAQTISALLQFERSSVTVPEGEEPDEFWAALGGKGEYPTSSTLATGSHEPRLFQLSNVHGGLSAEEIFDYTQDDLIQDDVMMLDTYDELFLWIGHNANREETELSLKMAFEYLDFRGRPADTPVFKVVAGAEPPNFTCHFLGWNDDKAGDFSDPYAAKMAALGISAGPGAQKPAAAAAAPERVTKDSIGFAKGTFSYEDLKNRTAPNVDPSKRESYLSDEEFQTVFKMTKDEFYKLAAWKQKKQKQDVGLF